jgi:hypothetical protein
LDLKEKKKQSEVSGVLLNPDTLKGKEIDNSIRSGFSAVMSRVSRVMSRVMSSDLRGVEPVMRSTVMSTVRTQSGVQ